jgi:hypothetical protein
MTHSKASYTSSDPVCVALTAAEVDLEDMSFHLSHLSRISSSKVLMCPVLSTCLQIKAGLRRDGFMGSFSVLQTSQAAVKCSAEESQTKEV